MDVAGERIGQLVEGIEEGVDGAQGTGSVVVGGEGFDSLGETRVAIEKNGGGEGGCENTAKATDGRDCAPDGVPELRW